MSFAQVHHSQAEIYTEFDHYKDQMKIGLFIELEQGWHTYYTNPGQTGQGPIIRFESEEITDSAIFAPAPSRHSTNTAESFVYEHEVLFYKTISRKAEGPISIIVDADWLVCKEICIPNTQRFHVSILDQGSLDKPHHIFSQFVFPQTQNSIESFIDQEQNAIIVQNLPSFSSIDVFPTNPMAFEFIKPNSFNTQNHQAIFTFSSVSQNPTDLVVVLYDKNKKPAQAFISHPKIHEGGTRLQTDRSFDTSETLSLIWVLFLALIGGLLLNLMPCVFPVISIKFFSISTLSNLDRKKMVISNVMYSAGVIVSLLALALTLVVLRSLGQEIGWGFQLQSPVSVTLMIILFYLIGLNFLGVFEVSQIPLPRWIQKRVHEKNLAGDFLTGVFTTVVATPCTAPFMAASIGYALSQNVLIILLTFFMLGIGLSLPYLILSIFPQLASHLPKPGQWMNKLKELFAFPMFLTCAWLIWVFSKITSAHGLLYLLVGLVFLEFSVRTFYLTQKKWIGWILFVITAFIFFYPLQSKNNPAEINWTPYSIQKVEALTSKQDQWVFIDFTADWCLTCKANEALTFTNSKVAQIIKEKSIHMIKADWTKKDAEITQTLTQYGRAGVPFYLLYVPSQEKPIILPTLLTPSIFLKAIKEHS
ncbi:MAG: thioredoxin family protein [Bdellovibrionales bacterium]|nr:thioredoxin family protein [Bdellovibrionales bacterium]